MNSGLANQSESLKKPGMVFQCQQMRTTCTISSPSPRPYYNQNSPTSKAIVTFTTTIAFLRRKFHLLHRVNDSSAVAVAADTGLEDISSSTRSSSSSSSSSSTSSAGSGSLQLLARSCPEVTTTYPKNHFHSCNTHLSRRNMSSGSASNDEALLAATRALIPSLTNALHKGQVGRIAVVGGNEDYTGAPYFAAISALKVGADLAHVFCVKNAGLVIKSYSPELIVHPILDSENALEQILEWAPRFHSFVIGPGLGVSDPAILETVARLILKLKELDKPMILDADGLTLVSQKPELVKNYNKVILTPNSIEFSRLCNAVLGGDNKPVPSVSLDKIKELSLALGNVTILSKGATDVVSNGRLAICCAGSGSNRRCGGQGDLLSGALAVFFHWALVYGDRGGPAPPELLATYGACRLTRECARLAYSQNGRSTTTTDLVRLIHQAFTFLFGN